MALRKISKTQTDVATWAADSAGIGTDIEKNGVLTRVDCTVEVTPSATFDGANQVDSLFRLIQNLRLVGGGHTYFNLPADDACMGGTLLHYLNRLDHQAAFHRSGDVAAPLRTYAPITWVLHAGARPKDIYGRSNPFDLSGVVPALHETTLRTEWVTAGNDVIDDTITIASAVMRFNIHYVTGSHEEIMAEMGKQQVRLPRQAVALGANAMIPAWSASVFPHTATASDYAEERDIPTDGWLMRVSLAEQDATGVRSIRAEDQVTGVKITIRGEELVKEFTNPWTAYLDYGSMMEADEAADDFGNHAPVGILIKDLRPHGHSDYGLNLMNVPNGSAKLGLTISVYASGDDSLILFERFLPYAGKLGF